MPHLRKAALTTEKRVVLHFLQISAFALLHMHEPVAPKSPADGLVGMRICEAFDEKFETQRVSLLKSAAVIIRFKLFFEPVLEFAIGERQVFRHC